MNTERLSSSIGCSHFGDCPGCVADSGVGNVSMVERARAYFTAPSVVRKILLPLPSSHWSSASTPILPPPFRVVIPSSLMGWHTQAKLAVSPRDGTGSRWGKNGCSFGLYKRSTHTVLPILDCSVHNPSVHLAVEDLTISPTDVQTTPYYKDTGDGGLRYVQLQVERDTGGICLSLIWNTNTVKGC